MKIALCVKQVPDTSDIKWTENNTMQREGVESILNPYDVYALEQTLRIKKMFADENIEITVFTMGPQQASEMLKDIIAVGADKGVLISDRKFAGADTFATGNTLAHSIKKALPDFDLIICGQFAIDGDTAQTGPCIAGILNIPQITYVREITCVEGRFVTAQRQLDDGVETVKVQTPALLCVLKSDFEPTRPLINGIIKAQDSEIMVLTLEDLDLTVEDVGLKGSPTYVSKAFRPEVKHDCQKYTQNGAEIMFDKIKEIGVMK